MKKWIGIAVIAVAVVALLIYKSVSGPSAKSAAPTGADQAPRVLMFIDLREIDEEHGCGDIIRSVRATAARGVATRENDDALGRAHRVMVEPTVLILDAKGREQARFEGESGATIAAMKTALDQLQP